MDNNNNNEEDNTVKPEGQEEEAAQVPSGILRLREEWRLSGLPVFGREYEEDSGSQIVFP
ncbi:MAG: hypothetical protein GX811_01915, partial [Lentisphaerae bacterium]|nr:hypothetical protein [Lentisphaerota bacterium]